MNNDKKIMFLTAWMLFLSSLFFMAFTDVIDTSLPAGSDDPAEADDNMRRIQGGFQEIGDVEHDYGLTGTEITGDGTHTAITTTSIVNAGTLANTGDVTVNTNKFTITAASGNTLVAGTLDVTGTLDVVGVATLGDGSLLAAAAESTDTDRTIADIAYSDGGTATVVDSVAAALVKDTVYLTQTAGTIIAWDTDNVTIKSFIGAANPPTLQTGQGGPGAAAHILSTFVPKGWYFKHTVSGGAFDDIIWIPLVNGGGAPIAQ